LSLLRQRATSSPTLPLKRWSRSAASGRRPPTTISAHSLKSSAAIFGVTVVQALASTVAAAVSQTWATVLVASPRREDRAHSHAGRRCQRSDSGDFALATLAHWGSRSPVFELPVMALPPFDSIAATRSSIEQLRGGTVRSTGALDVAHVLHHFAQSVEYSMIGLPQLKPTWFRLSVGPMAFAVFARRGRMSHGLDAPIPGAPDIAEGQPLDKPQFTQAHVMHLADHWQLCADR